MIAGLLLLPVGSILVWLYWYCLPPDARRKGRWRAFDTLLLLILSVLAGVYIYVARHADYVNPGPIWPEVLAVTGAYGLIAIGLAIGLALRRRAARQTPKE